MPYTEKRPNSPFGKRLKDFLHQRRLSQKQVAEELRNIDKISIYESDITELCKEYLIVTPAVHRRIYAIIKLLHRKKPLSIKAVNEFLQLIPEMEPLNVQNDEDRELLELLAFQPADGVKEAGENPLEVNVAKKENTEVAVEQSYTPAKQTQDEMEKPPIVKKQSKMLVIVGAAVALLIIVLFILFHFLMNEASVKANPPSLILRKILQQSTPYCDGKSDWSTPPNMQEGTGNLVCTQSGLQLQQYSPAKSHFAELDLTSVNGKPYNQTNFTTTVSIAFTQDDAYTYGCMVVQTPTGSPGGYTFCINNRGAWQLQDATYVLPPVVQGTVNVRQGQKIVIVMTVRSGLLTCSINGKVVVQSMQEKTQDISFSGLIGFVVEKNGAVQSAPILYTNFALFVAND